MKEVVFKMPPHLEELQGGQPSTAVRLRLLVDIVLLSTGEREEGEHVLTLPEGAAARPGSLGPWAEGFCSECCGRLDLTEVELPSSSLVMRVPGCWRVFMDWASCLNCCSLNLTTPVEEGDRVIYYEYKVAHVNAEQDGWRWNKHRTRGMIG